MPGPAGPAKGQRQSKMKKLERMKKHSEKIPNSNMDGGWKDVIEDFTEDFFRFYLPEMHERINFSMGIKFLDRELNEITSDSDNVKREADKLLEVYLKNGSAEWILIHIEVQSYKDDSFAERMYIYNYRIFDKYRKKVTSIAVLIDNIRNFRPDTYTMKQFECTVHFKFPVIKLLDFDSEEIADNNNPFAVVTRVQLAKIKSENNAEKRYSFRIDLTKELYRKDYTREQVIRLYRFIDYILTLPKPAALKFKKELELFEEAQKMPYITSTELIAREEGLLQGITKGITQGISQGITQGQLEEAQKAVLKVLDIRFGEIPYAVKKIIIFCDDLSKLEDYLQQAVLINALAEFG